MKTTPWIKLCKGAALALAVSYGLTYCHTTKSKLTLEQKGDSLTVIHITYPANYILLPIEEEAMESQVLLDTGEATDGRYGYSSGTDKSGLFCSACLTCRSKDCYRTCA